MDRKALPDPDKGRAADESSFVPPATDTEKQLAEIWEDVLGHAPISTTDNFFDCGGHSLKVTKVVSLVDRRFGIQVPLTVFFTPPSVNWPNTCSIT